MYRLLTYLLAPIALLASEMPLIQYWTDEDSNGWLAIACEQQGSPSRVTLIQPDGEAGVDLITEAWSNDVAVDLNLLDGRHLPTSAWWPCAGALQNLLQTTEGQPPAYRWSKRGQSAALQSLEPSDSGIPAFEISLQPLAQSIQLQTSDPLVEAHGLSFSIDAIGTLESTLQQHFRQIHRAHDLRIRQDEAEDPSIGDRPGRMIHELRLLHWTPERCSALVLTRSNRMFASTSIAIETINLSRNPDGSWSDYDPLHGQVDRAKLREAIRVLLNQQDANGDRFAEDYPDPISEEAQQTYTALRLGNRLYLVFEPYAVASGAWGTVTISPAMYE